MGGQWGTSSWSFTYNGLSDRGVIQWVCMNLYLCFQERTQLSQWLQVLCRLPFPSHLCLTCEQQGLHFHMKDTISYHLIEQKNDFGNQDDILNPSLYRWLWCMFFFVFFTFKPNFSVAFIPLIFLFPNKMQSSFFLRSDDVNWYFKTEHEPRLLAFASCFGLSGCQKEQVLSPCYSGDNVTSLLLNTSGISMSV